MRLRGGWVIHHHRAVVVDSMSTDQLKTVTLPTDMWLKIWRRLTAEVGSDDESRRWAECIKEQTSGLVKVRISTSKRTRP
jgi:hypothetical protein